MYNVLRICDNHTCRHRLADAEMTAIEKDVCIQGSPNEGPWEDTISGVRAGSLRVSQKAERAQDGTGRAFIVVTMEELER